MVEKKYIDIEKLEKDPVIESIVELRFRTHVPTSAISGIFYTLLQDDYINLKPLPISQLPDMVRLNDPNLRHKPTHIMSSKNNRTIVMFGGGVLSVNVDNPKYIGWSNFSDEVFRVMDKLYASSIAPQITRVGVRYISFFSSLNIFDHIKLQVNSPYEEDITKGNTSFITEMKHDNIISRLSLQNNANIKKANQALEVGSVVDIDSYSLEPVENEKTLRSFINTCHSEEKDRFFSLLKDDFLESLKPQYTNKD